MTTDTKEGSQAPPNAKFLVLPIIIIICAQMGSAGHSGAVGIATTALTDSLHATLNDIQLANLIDPLIGGAFMIAGGLIGTIWEWKKTLRLGAFLCGIGEVIAASAVNMDMFNWGGCLLVGCGASLMIPSLVGLIPFIYKGANRVQAFALLSSATGLSTILPFLFGIVMQFGGFRLTFAILAVYFFFVTCFTFKLPVINQKSSDLHFDTLGTILSAIGLFLFLIGLSSLSRWGIWYALPGAPHIGNISPAIPMIIAGIIVLSVMMVLEKRVQKKYGICLIPQSFVKTPQVLTGLIIFLITSLAIGSQSILLGPYLQLVADWPAFGLGAASLFVGVPTFFVSAGWNKWFPHLNPRYTLMCGLAFSIAAQLIVAFSLTHNGANVFIVLTGNFFSGFGLGVVYAQTSNIIALAVDDRDVSQSGGIQATARNVGYALGVALLGTILIAGISGTTRRELSSMDVRPQVVSEVSNARLDLISNEALKKKINTFAIKPTQEEYRKITEVYENQRLSWTRISYYIIVGFLSLGFLIIPAIRITTTQERQAMLARKASSQNSV